MSDFMISGLFRRSNNTSNNKQVSELQLDSNVIRNNANNNTTNNNTRTNTRTNNNNNYLLLNSQGNRMNVTNFKGELTKLFNSIQKLADESQEKDKIISNLKNKGNSSNLKVLVNKLFQYIKEINEVFSAEPENRLRMLNVLKEKIDQNRDL